MKVFLDTNIFLEYFERRRQYQAVSQLLSAIEDGRLKAVAGQRSGHQSQTNGKWQQRPCL